MIPPPAPTSYHTPVRAKQKVMRYRVMSVPRDRYEWDTMAPSVSQKARV